MSAVSEVVTAAEVPVKILCYGPYTPSKRAKNPSDKPTELVVVIPGNPGIAEFMHGFGKAVHKKSGLPVWIIGHGGHSEYHGEDREELYTVAAQIRQKQDIIDCYLKDVKIRFVCHSFGCYVVLKLLASEEIAKNTLSAYLICPVVENIALTPRGRYIPTKCMIEANSLICLYYLFSLIPRSWKECLATLIAKLLGRYNGDMREGFMILLDHKVLTNLKALGMNELEVIKERDDDTIRKNLNKLRLYYMENDGYVPIEFMKDIIQAFPTLKTHLDDRGTEHGFTHKSSDFVADVIVAWIREDSL